MILICLIPIRSHHFTRIVISPFEKRLQKEIKIDSSRIWVPANIFLKGVSIIEEDGRVYYIDKLDVRYNLFNLLFGKKEFRFKAEDIKLYENIGLLDSVASILAISTMPDIEFEEIKGVLELRRNGVFITDAHALSKKIRIEGGGWIDKEGLLDCEVTFSFSRDITDMIPDVVKVALLTDEAPGWMGITFKVHGNYKRPTLRITADALKINIMKGIERLIGDE